MPTRAEVVERARACIGTPFRHQGRLPGRGLDCVGIVIHVANALGFKESFDFRVYSRFPDQILVMGMLGEHLDRLGSILEAGDGDVLLMVDDRWSVHVGILATDAS